jgi:hypothetical protein
VQAAGRAPIPQSRSRAVQNGEGRADMRKGDDGRIPLLRRSHRPAFEMKNGVDMLRLRRARRVSGSFSAIPDLSRGRTS